MKTLKFLGALLAVVAVISIMLISSCKKDTSVPPTIAFQAGAGLTSADATIDSGTVVTVSISAFPSTSSNAKLEDVTFTITFNNTPVFTNDSSFKDVSYTHNYTFTVNWVGSARISATVTDKDGGTATAAINITGKKPTTGVTLSSSTSLTMGGSTSTYGSYLDAETGTVYSLSQVNGSTTIKNAIDIIFDNSILNSTASVITSTGTEFASTTLTSANFDAITTDATFGSYTANLTQITISAGQVVFFQTIGGKKGLFKVISMTSATGDLNFGLKIQP